MTLLTLSAALAHQAAEQERELLGSEALNSGVPALDQSAAGCSCEQRGVGGWGGAKLRTLSSPPRE